MADGIRWVGLDVHATQTAAAMFDTATGEIRSRKFAGRPHEVMDWLVALPKPVRAVYEAGPTGYGLARRARAAGIDMQVCAPGMIAPGPGGRVKTDKRDALKLARLHAAGQLVLDRRDVHQHQLAGGEQPRQLQRVALVGLDALGRRPDDHARRAHLHVEAGGAAAARQPVARRPGLIDDPDGPLELHQPAEHLVRAAHESPRHHLPGRVIEHRARRLVGVHVKTDPTSTVGHAGTSVGCGPVAPREPSSAPTSHPRTADGAVLPTPRPGLITVHMV